LRERAIGVIYRPETELQSHYFYAKISLQFDSIIHIDNTNALKPLLDKTEDESSRKTLKNKEVREFSLNEFGLHSFFFSVTGNFPSWRIIFLQNENILRYF